MKTHQLAAELTAFWTQQLDSCLATGASPDEISTAMLVIALGHQQKTCGGKETARLLFVLAENFFAEAESHAAVMH